MPVKINLTEEFTIRNEIETIRLRLDVVRFKKELYDLNADNVMGIFRYCKIADADIGKNPEDEERVRILVEKFSGKDSPEIVFSRKKLFEDEGLCLLIAFWYGQLKASHEEKERMTLTEGFIKYTGEKWADKNTALQAFYYLGVASGTIPFFMKENDKEELFTLITGFEPELSPKDPGFDEFYKDIEI